MEAVRGQQSTKEDLRVWVNDESWRECVDCMREKQDSGVWFLQVKKLSDFKTNIISKKRNRPHCISGWSMHILHDQGAECDSALQCFYSSKQPPLILRGSHKTWIRCIRQIISSAIQDAKSSPVDDSCTVRSTHFIPFHTTAYELWHAGQTTAATHTHRHTDTHTRLGTNYYIIIIVIKNLAITVFKVPIYFKNLSALWPSAVSGNIRATFSTCDHRSCVTF